MNPPQISIIIPVYNSEKYLGECLESITKQTFTDFEVLLINDGSTDKSGAICDQYADKDFRFKVFHKENGGVSSARNFGLEKAIGEWITFVDSDDKISRAFLSSFFPINKVADFLLQGAKSVNKNIEANYFEFEKDELLNVNVFFEKYSINPWLSQPWGKLYKLALIREKQISFDNEINWGEDTLFILTYLKYCLKIGIKRKELYLYRLGGNLTNRDLDYKYFIGLLDIIKNRIEELKEVKKLESFNVSFQIHLFIKMAIISIVNDEKLSKESKVFEILKLYHAQYRNEILYYFRNERGNAMFLWFLLKIRFTLLFKMVFKYALP